jgi:hypothetical protein
MPPSPRAMKVVHRSGLSESRPLTTLPPWFIGASDRAHLLLAQCVCHSFERVCATSAMR